MKVAVLTHALNGIDGITKHVLRMAQEFRAMGIEHDVWAVEYTPENCPPEWTEGLNIRSVRREMDRGSFMGNVESFRMIAYLRKLYAYYQDQQALLDILPNGYDVVNPHGNNIVYAASQYKAKYNTPVVWMCNDFAPPTGKPFRRKTLKDVVKDTITLPIYNYDQRMVNQSDEVVVLSPGVQQDMQSFYGMSSRIIPTGIDPIPKVTTDDSTLRAKLGVPRGKFLLLTVASLMYRRRVEYVLDAICMLLEEGHNLHYVHVGSTDHTPSYTEKIFQMVQDLGLGEHVTFTGEVSEDTLVEAFNAADTFVWAADGSQSWGMACLEALSCGTPVVVSEANGIASVLEHREQAMLFEDGNIQELAAAIRTLLTDEALRAQLGANGEPFVRENLSLTRNAELMLDAYQHVID